MILSADGGALAGRTHCQIGFYPLVVVYEDGSVIAAATTKPGWRRGRLTKRALDELRSAARDAAKFAGRVLKAQEGSDLGSAHILSRIDGASFEVSVYGDVPWREPDHGKAPREVAHMIDLLLAGRDVADTPYAPSAAWFQVRQSEQACTLDPTQDSRSVDCRWPPEWPAPADGMYEVALRTGDVREVDERWRNACPSRAPNELCKNGKLIYWCAAPKLPGVPVLH